MLPTFTEPISIGRVDPDDLRVVWLEEATEGIGDNRLYFEIADVSWDEAAETIAAERELVGIAAAEARDPDDFDRVADQLVLDRYSGDWDDDGPLDDGPLARFQGLDLGVMSAVASLIAAGALTTTSCRGHHSNQGERRPLVRFICDEHRLPAIVSAAESANCGLLLDPRGLLQLYATDVEAFLRFSDEMVARRKEFGALPTAEPVVSMEIYDAYLDAADTDSDRGYFSRRDLTAVRQRMASEQPL